MTNFAKIKWNNGNLAICCSKCSKIIKEGKDFTELEWSAIKGKSILPRQYCNNCIEKLIKKDKNEAN